MGWNIIALPEYFWNNFHPPNQQTGQEAVQVYRFSKPCFYLYLSLRENWHMEHSSHRMPNVQKALKTL